MTIGGVIVAVPVVMVMVVFGIFTRCFDDRLREPREQHVPMRGVMGMAVNPPTMPMGDLVHGAEDSPVLQADRPLGIRLLCRSVGVGAGPKRLRAGSTAVPQRFGM